MNQDIFQSEVEQKHKVLIIDQSNLAHITIFSALNEFTQMLNNMIETNISEDTLYKIFKQKYLQRFFDLVFELRPTKVIFALDNKNYWRRDIYKEYKAQRQDARDNSKLDFDKFYPILNEFLDRIKEAFTNVYFLKVDRCEADDIIAILARDTFKDHSVVIYSNDGDFNQLLIHPHIKRYNPNIREGSKLVKIEDPELLLNIKIIVGDNGDNIPNIMVLPEKYPHKTERRFGCGKVMAKKILDLGIDSDFVSDKILKSYPSISTINEDENSEKINPSKFAIKLVEQNFNRNRTLIDFKFIPEQYKKSIETSYHNYELKSMDLKKCYVLLFGNGYINLYSDYQNRFKKLLESLN